MGLIVKLYTFSAGSVVTASEHNSNFDVAYAVINGNLENVNIKASAGIVDTKLAQITTANKVNITALAATSQATGDLIYYNGSSWVRLPIGIAGQILTVNGAATAPEWA